MPKERPQYARLLPFVFRSRNLKIQSRLPSSPSCRFRRLTFFAPILRFSDLLQVEPSQVLLPSFVVYNRPPPLMSLGAVVTSMCLGRHLPSYMCKNNQVRQAPEGKRGLELPSPELRPRISDEVFPNAIHGRCFHQRRVCLIASWTVHL